MLKLNKTELAIKKALERKLLSEAAVTGGARLGSKTFMDGLGDRLEVEIEDALEAGGIIKKGDEWSIGVSIGPGLFFQDYQIRTFKHSYSLYFKDHQPGYSARDNKLDTQEIPDSKRSPSKLEKKRKKRSGGEKRKINKIIQKVIKDRFKADKLDFKDIPWAFFESQNIVGVFGSTKEKGSYARFGITKIQDKEKQERRAQAEQSAREDLKVQLRQQRETGEVPEDQSYEGRNVGREVSDSATIPQRDVSEPAPGGKKKRLSSNDKTRYIQGVVGTKVDGVWKSKTNAAWKKWIVTEETLRKFQAAFPDSGFDAAFLEKNKGNARAIAEKAGYKLPPKGGLNQVYLMVNKVQGDDPGVVPASPTRSRTQSRTGPTTSRSDGTTSDETSPPDGPTTTEEESTLTGEPVEYRIKEWVAGDYLEHEGSQYVTIYTQINPEKIDQEFIDMIGIGEGGNPVDKETEDKITKSILTNKSVFISMHFDLDSGEQTLGSYYFHEEEKDARMSLLADNRPEGWGSLINDDEAFEELVDMNYYTQNVPPGRYTFKGGEVKGEILDEKQEQAVGSSTWQFRSSKQFGLSELLSPLTEEQFNSLKDSNYQATKAYRDRSLGRLGIKNEDGEENGRPKKYGTEDSLVVDTNVGFLTSTFESRAVAGSRNIIQLDLDSSNMKKHGIPVAWMGILEDHEMKALKRDYGEIATVLDGTFDMDNEDVAIYPSKATGGSVFSDTVTAAPTVFKLGKKVLGRHNNMEIRLLFIGDSSGGTNSPQSAAISPSDDPGFIYVMLDKSSHRVQFFNVDDWPQVQKESKIYNSKNLIKEFLNIYYDLK